MITASGDIVVGTQGAGLISLDPEGRERWRVELVGDVDSAPALGRDGSIYVGDDGGRLVAVSARGQVRWTADVGGPVRSAVTLDLRSSKGKRARAPKETERIYVTTLAGSLHAFNRSGASLWSLEIGAPIQATPAVDGEGTLFFGAQDERLYAVTRAGDVRWRIDLPEDVDSSVAISPGGRLVFGADDGMLRAVADPSAPVDR